MQADPQVLKPADGWAGLYRHALTRFLPPGDTSLLLTLKVISPTDFPSPEFPLPPCSSLPSEQNVITFLI